MRPPSVLLRSAISAYLILSVVLPDPVQAFTPEDPLVIVVDAGHGSHPSYDEYTGAYNPRVRVYEDPFNLDLALRVAAALEARGAEVYLTRRNRYLPLDYNGDGEWTNSDRYTYALRLAEFEGEVSKERADAYVSLHLNAHRSPSRRGTTAVYSSRGAAAEWEEESERLARSIYNQLIQVLPSSAPPFPVNGLYLDKLALPHAVIEVLFLTNPSDLHWIQQEENRQLAAELIAAGIFEWWSQGRREARQGSSR